MTARFLVFQLGDERFALPLEAVDAVIETPPIQRLPDAPRNVLGVATLRGELVSIYDPRRLLHVGGGRHSATLLFSTDDRRVGIAIDDVFDPMGIEPDELRGAPGTEASDGMLLGVIRRGPDLIGILDASALLSALEEPEI